MRRLCRVESQEQAQRLAGGERCTTETIPKHRLTRMVGEMYGKEAGSQMVQLNKTVENPKIISMSAVLV